MKETAERIQKFLASKGLGSRREIETWIVNGRLSVNGKPAELGMKVSGRERFSLDKKPLRLQQETREPRKILMYHKPPGEICSKKDPEGRKSVFDALPRLRQGRWISIGRLDLNTAGLLLFTNDGELAHRLMHPSAEIAREYWVRVAGEVTPETLETLRRGLTLDDGFAQFQEITALKPPHEDDTQHNRYFSVVLREGRNREVRRLWEAVGCQVSRLKRTRFGNIILPRLLRPGQCRLLSDSEARELLSLSRKTRTRKEENHE